MRRGGFGADHPPSPKLAATGEDRRRLVRRIVKLFRPYRRQVTLVTLGILLSAGFGVINPLLIKVIFDTALFVPGKPPDIHRLFVLVGVMIAIPIVTGTIGIGQTYLTNQVGQRVMQDLRNKLYSHLQYMSLQFFTSNRTGEIQSRLNNDVGGVQTIVTDTASSVFSNIVILISTVIAMTIMSWQLTVLSLAMLPVFLFLTYRAGEARRRLSTSAQESIAALSAITQETLSVSGILLSKVFGRQQNEIERFAEENQRQADLAIRREMIGRGLFAVVQVFFSSAPALVYLTAGLVITHGGSSAVTAGTIVAFTTLQSRLFFPIGQMLQVSVEIQGSLALFERIFEYLDLPHEITTDPEIISPDPKLIRGQIKLDHVYFNYQIGKNWDDTSALVAANSDQGSRRQWALEDISFTVEPGKLAALVGPSGAGKTTISYLIPRLYDITKGNLTIDDYDVRKLSQNVLAEVIGMVTQETYLFHSSVRQNLLYAKPTATQKELEDAAKAGFIHDRIMQLKDGYNTMVGERGYRMSGGEKQRLAIARVILKSPQILILDEATSALDTTSERLVQAALQPLMQGRTTIAIAHRLSTILAADVIFVIDNGKLVEQGNHEQLLRTGNVYAQLYQQQFQKGSLSS